MNYVAKCFFLGVMLAAGLTGNVIADDKEARVEAQEREMEERAEKFDKERADKKRSGKERAMKERGKKERMAKERKQTENQKRDGVDDAEAASEKANQMRSRNEQRKTIKEEYDASGEKVKGKKPWWKFWGEEQ